MTTGVITTSAPQPQQSTGGAVAATVGCAVVGLIVGGPVGMIVGGSLGAIATSSSSRQSTQTTSLAVSRIQLPRQAISEHQGVTYFAVDLTLADGTVWRILRRYSDFDNLRRQIGLGNLFPRKHWFGCQGARLEERRRRLETWLAGVLSHYRARGIPNRAIPLLRNFLETGRRELSAAVMTDTQGDQVVSVRVPTGVVPGQPIRFTAPDGRHFFVNVPVGATPGTVLQVPLASAAPAPAPSDAPLLAQAPLAEPPVAEQPASAVSPPGISGEKVLLSIEVPQGVTAGQVLGVKVPDGRELRVVVPEASGGELQLEFDPTAGSLTIVPAEPSAAMDAAKHGSALESSAGTSARQEEVVLSVAVPNGVAPGQTLSVAVPDGQQLPVVVPSGVPSGGTFLVRLDPRSGRLVNIS